MSTSGYLVDKESFSFLEGVPKSVFDSHTHPMSDLTGVLGVAQGGTGQTSIAGVLSAFGLSKMQYGTYVGTGVYGTSNKNTILFPFKPRIILLYGTYGKAWCLDDIGYMSDDVLGNHSSCVTSWINMGSSGWSFQWYNGKDAYFQFNQSAAVYFYIGIGEA